jgi:poly(3-hydroxybutyrate) depolymerase
MHGARTRIFLVALVLGSQGCGSDDSGGGASGTGGSAGAGAGGSGGGSTDPLVLVPPKALEADPSQDCPAAFANAPAAGQNAGFDAAGQSRSFQLSLPGGEHSGPRPLMVVFNGTGENGLDIFQRANMSDFVDAGFIVVAPDSIGNGTLWPVWDGIRLPEEESMPNADLEYFDGLVKCLAAHFSVDQHRIYVSGHSAGGIFTNRVLRTRSDLVAGGIPASGVFDYTAPDPAPAFSGVAVLVTWGGDNDSWGGSASGVTVPEFNFVEQAALASQYYEAAPGVDQAYCRGKNLGHAWLSAANGWMMSYLLAHPKGLATNSPWQYVAPDAAAAFECSPDAASFQNPNEVSCGSSSTTGCQDYCQLLGDCAVENATIEPVLAPQLELLGFSGAKHLECGGCITQCEAAATTPADTSVLACFQTEAATIQCAGGIAGAQPMIDTVNQCCQNQTTSGVCAELCGAIQQNSAAAALFPSCAAF